ncbi:HEAT repeat domain-containing protein [Nostoc sp. 'Lobaria pulmonaria (5183) cyanobiont']|uniref:HEAT repeat domain-containing protein n=1 Tax=Nostoc sp. 'Lobaria pulmonaria (5183) cyanobiont' TaxID=1618022 RepID=UPI000CF30035|nr:HEAT repeat domain-containing protein [Nostoc sp. 'Lobaria pulmonaria (5183) cyanobiont']AVH73477.1 PBS lyase HEAT-like repeat-containing protein [Nostoc sp. 'Lobaria pulmonaria (5183) cyanobiont']
MHDWQYFFNHDRSNLNQGTYRIFEPEWKAEILHWFSQKDVDKQQKEDFIQALIDFVDGCGDFYRYRAYFLAAEALSQFPESSLGDAIVEQLLKWSYAYFRQDKRDWQILPKPLVKTARKTLELTDRKRVIAAFVHLVHTTESRSILRVAAEELGTLDPGNKSAIAALLLLIQQNNSHLRTAIYSLGKIGYGNETVITTLIQFIKITPGNVIHSLGKIGYGNETAIAALIQFIKMKPDDIANEWLTLEDIYEGAIIALGEIASGNQIAIATLIDFIKRYKDDVICSHASKALWDIDPGNPIALNTLVQILETTENTYLLDMSVRYLMVIDPGNKAAITILTERIKTTENEFFLCKAALCLGKFDSGNRVAITTLSKILETAEEEWVYFYAADILARTNDYQQQIIKAMWKMVNLKDESTSLSALLTLLEIDCNNQQVIDTLIRLLNTTKNESIFTSAAYSLQQFNPSIKLETEKLNELIAIFIRFIQTHHDLEVEEDENEDLFPLQWLWYESSLLDIADSLKKILQREHLPQVVITLKDYLSKQFYSNNSYRYEAVFNIIWHCAENLTYPDFYKAIN